MPPTTAPEQSADSVQQLLTWMKLPSHWPAQMDLLEWCQKMPPFAAAFLLMFGLIYLLYGVAWYRSLVTLNAAILGAYLGYRIGRMADGAVFGAFLGGVTAAALTMPTMKWAVAVMGGVFGALLGASIWCSIGLEPRFAWAGGLSGLIFFGMLSFIIFRGSIITYMALQGSVMTIFGLLGLIFKSTSIAPDIMKHMSLKPFLLPAAIFLPALFGLIYQQSAGGPAAEPKKK